MGDVCALCHMTCLPEQDVLRCIPARVGHDGIRRQTTDPSGDFTIHRACLKGLDQPATETPSPPSAPSAPDAEFEMPDVLDFLE